MSADLPEETQLYLSLVNAPASTGNFPLPGVTDSSTKKLVEKLKTNYTDNSAFFAGTIFHNHVMDHLLAMWGVGATADALEEVYVTHDYEEPVQPSPEPITDSNFVAHLGDPDFYSAYMVYFCKKLTKASVTGVLERFVFSAAYNVDTGLSHDKKTLKAGERHPEMLGRVMSGLLHPLIHIGYGAEFGILQQVAEGAYFPRITCAQTAIHPDDQTPNTPLHLFTSADKYGRGLSKLALPARSSGPPPFLSFHSAIAADPRFGTAALGFVRPKDGEDPVMGELEYAKISEIVGTAVAQLASEWYDRWIVGVPEDELEDRLQQMVEEVIVGNVYWYAVAGFAGRGKEVFNADLYTRVSALALPMHFVTSSIFLPTLALPPGRTKASTLDPPLSLASRLLLIRAYLAACAVWYIARYRPTNASMSISAFYAATGARLAQPPAPHAYAPGKAPRRDFFKNCQKTVPFGASGWLRVVQSAVVHPNEHLIKLVRALGAFDLWYGARGLGAYAGALNGAEELDGTLFLRAAVLTMDRLGWAYEEEPLALWDKRGYFDCADGENAS
ncbi:hypothetical protein K488DRAFT_57715 [Vararia minispora EC-137]|uniref:Uncharacterized protein n=1 Tax=Vararia minispora EC-137 TaxID=1314806 RepID=A0ACB8QAH7_9AGAM|nr:hypothetical protein K488DRAFT_57715 [Vararia minispora EC-137]